MSAVIFLAQTLPGQTWTQLSPTGTPPVARGLHGTTGVYDPATNRMIVFGGRDGSGTNLNDVWILINTNGLGGSSQWVNLIPNGADGSPPARSGHSAVYDAANNIMIIFGGCSGYCTPALNDVWTLSNANGLGGTPVWTQLAVDTTAPQARTNAAAAYDASQNRLFVYSGQDGSADPCSTFSDVWSLQNANGLDGPPSLWSNFSPLLEDDPLTSPSPGLNAAASAYDPVTGSLTLFGGITTVNSVCRETNGVWQLNFHTFPSLMTLLADGTAGSPPARSFVSGVYDATAGRMIVFGGEENGIAVNDVWSLSDATGLGRPVWSMLSPSGSPPAARNSDAAVFDSATQRMIVFAGSNAGGVLNDSWILAAPGMSGFSCNANQLIPDIVRAEGMSELVGDGLLICTGGTPTPSGMKIPEYKVTITLNTNITSQRLPEGSNLSEAVLLIDEPFPTNPFPSPDDGGPAVQPDEPNQIVCKPFGFICTETGTGGSPSPYQTQPNVFVGKQIGSKMLQWTVPIDPPGVNLTRRIRLTTLRANANGLGVPIAFSRAELQATFDIQGDAVVPINHPQQVVALSEAAAVVSSDGGNLIPQCVPHNASLLGGSGAAAFDFNVQVAEQHPDSFQYRDGLELFGPDFPQPLPEQNVSGWWYRTESGFYSPSLFTVAPSLGLADFGTRIRLKLGPHPAGSHLFVPVTITMTGDYDFYQVPPGQLQLVKADTNGLSTPGYKPVRATAMVDATPVAEASYAGSAAYAIYEVVYSVPYILETAPIPVAVAFSGSPATGQVTVTPSFAPLDLTKTASTNAPVPRFASIYAAQPAFSIQKCAVSTLSANITSKTGPQNARVWNIQVNSGANAATDAQIENLTVSHASGKTCHPTITSPSFPFSLGDISPKSSVTTPVTIDFTGCGSAVKFQTTIGLSANGGLSNATVVKSNQTP